MIDWTDWFDEDDMAVWGSKGNTSSSDLYSATLCYVNKSVNGINDLKNLNLFLDAIKPPSGWEEDKDFDPTKERVRGKYGKNFYLLHRKE